MNNPYSREHFNSLRDISKKKVKKVSNMAALVSVTLGLLSLWILNSLDPAMTRSQKTWISLLVFAVFIGIVAWLLYRIRHISKKTALACPHCKKLLFGDAERIAGATGRCQYCGGIIIND
ncbi:MAG: hypothetical protein ACM3PT_13395 [Deltaproteobacteria bacterium]